MAPSARRPGLLASGLILGVVAAGLSVLWRGAAGDGPILASPAPSFPRLVSLAPSITECLFAIGADETLVGVTDACDFPPEAAALPRVGSFTHPDLERILSLRPDAILTSTRAPVAAREFLQKNRIRVIPVPMDRLEDVPRGLELVGDISGRGTEARAYAREWRRRLSELRSRRPTGPSKRVFLEIWHDPLTAPGASSFLTEAIEAAGGASVTADIPGEYVQVSPDHVVRARPDVIVLAYMGASTLSAEDVGRRVGWGELPAVRNRKVVSDIDPSLLLRPGPRLLEGISALARKLEDD